MTTTLINGNKRREFYVCKEQSRIDRWINQETIIYISMYMAWMQADVMIKGWLTTTMERDIRTNVRYANTPVEIWKDLEEQLRKREFLMLTS